MAHCTQQQQKTFVVRALGCRTNQYEAEAFRNQLERLGYVKAEEGQQADLCLIHTCAITESAESSSRHAIRSAVARHRPGRVVVTGCLAKKEGGRLSSIEGVTDVIGTEEKEGLIQRLFPDAHVHPFSITRFEDHTRAFVKIQDGCNHFCSYCIVPYLRGPSRSRPMEAILDEVNALVAGGYQEIVLTGVNVGDYADHGRSLAELMQQIDALSGVRRLRLSSINPNEVSDELIATVAEGRSTCPSLHLVLQSGSNAILKSMRRPYSRELYLEKAAAFRQRCPDCTFTTDIIVGHPGETDTDFLDTLDMIRTVGFAKVHMFPYSQRPQTRAARLPDTVPPSVITERKAQLLKLADQVAFELRQPYVGRMVEVLTESDDAEGSVQGQTKNGLSVLLPQGGVPPNQLVTVQIRENRTCGLIGILQEEPS